MLGSASAASRPMTATTIIISTRVNAPVACLTIFGCACTTLVKEATSIPRPAEPYDGTPIWLEIAQKVDGLADIDNEEVIHKSVYLLFSRFCASRNLVHFPILRSDLRDLIPSHGGVG